MPNPFVIPAQAGIQKPSPVARRLLRPAPPVIPAALPSKLRGIQKPKPMALSLPICGKRWKTFWGKSRSWSTISPPCKSGCGRRRRRWRRRRGWRRGNGKSISPFWNGWSGTTSPCWATSVWRCAIGMAKRRRRRRKPSGWASCGNGALAGRRILLPPCQRVKSLSPNPASVPGCIASPIRITSKSINSMPPGGWRGSIAFWGCIHSACIL